MILPITQIRENIIRHIDQEFQGVLSYSVSPENYTGDKTEGWVEFDFDFGRSSTVYKGGGSATRHTGVIYASVRVPLLRVGPHLTGSAKAFELAEQVLSGIERKRLNGSFVVALAGSLDLDGPVDEYYFIELSIPFTLT